MSREEAEEEIMFVLSVAGERFRKGGRWWAPPGAAFAVGAMKLGTCILEGVFGYQRSITDIGVGKSVYGLKTLMAVYGSWQTAKNYIVFMPQEFIRIFEWAVDGGVRIPAMMWDDAGMWLGRLRWQNEFVKTVKEFLNVVRTHVAYICFTAPTHNELARGIRERIKVFNFVRRWWNAKSIDEAEAEARYYTYSMLEERGRRGLPPPIMTYTYRLRFPYYDEYKEKREAYVKVGLERMKEKLHQIATKASEELRELMKKVDAGKRVEPLVEVDGS